jgi:hypothetical protein
VNPERLPLALGTGVEWGAAVSGGSPSKNRA